MNPVISKNGEIPLIIDSAKSLAIDGVDDDFIDSVEATLVGAQSTSDNCLVYIDSIVDKWLLSLTKSDWRKINRQRSLHGIKIPDKWVKTWRYILKDERLRTPSAAHADGRKIGSQMHIWNLWASDCVNKYLNDIEKEILDMYDKGYLHTEIGDKMLRKYGKDFWKPRKSDSSTTPKQVVNNYFYLKMPTKIAKGELTDLVLMMLKNKRKATN